MDAMRGHRESEPEGPCAARVSPVAPTARHPEWAERHVHATWVDYHLVGLIAACILSKAVGVYWKREASFYQDQVHHAEA